MFWVAVSDLVEREKVWEGREEGSIWLFSGPSRISHCRAGLKFPSTLYTMEKTSLSWILRRCSGLSKDHKCTGRNGPGLCQRYWSANQQAEMVDSGLYSYSLGSINKGKYRKPSWNLPAPHWIRLFGKFMLGNSISQPQSPMHLHLVPFSSRSGMSWSLRRVHRHPPETRKFLSWILVMIKMTNFFPLTQHQWWVSEQHAGTPVSPWDFSFIHGAKIHGVL